jgi:hypothetical protein
MRKCWPWCSGTGLLFDQIPQVLGQGANDHDAQLVGAVLWGLTLSMGALGMAYLSRTAWKLGRMSEGLASCRRWS